jgi:hypothetical protein
MNNGVPEHVHVGHWPRGMRAKAHVNILVDEYILDLDQQQVLVRDDDVRKRISLPMY